MADGDRLLTIGGIVLGLTILLMLGVIAITFAHPPRGGANSPDAEWTLDRVNATHVRLTHAGGESVSAGRLVVTVGGNDRRVTWTADGVERRVTYAGPVSEGDSGVFRARADRLVRLYWETDRGERVRLDDWRT